MLKFLTSQAVNANDPYLTIIFIKNLMKLYQYPKCSTCRKAIKFLNEKNISFDLIDISQQQPNMAELQQMLKSQGELKKLFNTSGMQYRDLDMKNKLPSLSEDEALLLLANNGMLIKRPFLIGGGVGLVGFKESIWLESL